ncbi:MAG: hypothetical protein ACRDP6_32545 [Actinoallomurus sp.]
MTTTSEQRGSTAAAPSPSARVARVVTEICAPSVLIVVLCLAVGWHAGRWSGLAWGLAAAVCASLGPMSVVVIGVIRRRYTDHHLTTHEDRKVFLIIALFLVVAGTIVLAVAGAPRDVVAVEAAMLAGLLVSTAITRVWKISFHTGVAAAALVIVTILYGPWLTCALPVLILIGWSRVRLHHHTLGQVLAGAPIGAVAATLAFLAVR